MKLPEDIEKTISLIAKIPETFGELFYSPFLFFANLPNKIGLIPGIRFA
jgi:hypothetical protein